MNSSDNTVLFSLHGADVGIDGELLEELRGVGQSFGDVIRVELRSIIFEREKRK